MIPLRNPSLANDSLPLPPSNPTEALTDRFDGVYKTFQPQDEYLAALQERMRLEAFPRATIDTDAYARAARRLQGILIARKAAKKQGSRAGDIRLDGTPDDKEFPVWTSFGPDHLPVPSQANYGPPDSYLSGRVNAVAYDPLNQGVAYVTGAQGGVWQTLDAGKNWTPLGDKWPTLYCGPIAINPLDSTKIFVGTGDFKGSVGSQYAVGIMYSADAGVTWNPIASAIMAKQCVSAIAIDASTPNVMVATTGRGTSPGGIYRSADGGATWTSVTPTNLTGDWSSVSISVPDKAQGGRRYYYASLIGNGVYKSIDKGLTWTKLPVPLAFNTVANPAGGLGLQVSASRVNYNVVYVIDGSATSLDGRIFRSITTGATWIDTSANYPTTAGGYNNFAKSTYALHITPVIGVNTSGAKRDMVYSGGLTLAATPTGGANWTDISFTLTPNARTHNDQLGADGDPFNFAKALIVNAGGVYGVTFDNVSQNWFFDGSLNATLRVTQFNKADWSLTQKNVSVGGAQDNAVPTSSGDPVVVWKNGGDGDGGGVASNVDNPANQFASYSTLKRKGFIDVTSDYWTSSNNIAPNWTDTNAMSTTSVPPQVGVIATNPAPNNPSQPERRTIYPFRGFNFAYAYNGTNTTSNYLFYGTQYLWRYDGGDWEKTTGTMPKVRPMGGTSLTAAPNYVSAIAVSATPLLNPDGSVGIPGGHIVYAGTSDGRLWFTLNALVGDASPPPEGLVQWFEITGAGLPARAITSISLNPNNPGDILVTLAGTGTGHVFRCGNTLSPAPRFTDQSGFGAGSLLDVPVNDITRDQADPENVYYVATDLGVFGTADGGSTWAVYGDNLPIIKCTSIKATYRPDDTPGAIVGPGLLHVATFGRGLWRISLDPVGSPNIQVRAVAKRSVDFLNIAVTIQNLGRQVNNFEINSVTLVTDRGQSIPLLIPGADAFPIGIGSLPKNGVRLLNAQFAGGLVRTGTGATIKVEYRYGGLKPDKKLSSSVRTRLP